MSTPSYKSLGSATAGSDWMKGVPDRTHPGAMSIPPSPPTPAAEDGSGLVERTWKATEHHIDVGAFFAMLHRLTGDQTWKTRSDDAFTFVRSMISDDRNHLWTGTGPDGVTVDEEAVPEDVQVWSHLDAYDPEALSTAPTRAPSTEPPAAWPPPTAPSPAQLQHRRHQRRLVRGHRPPPGRLQGPQLLR
ncbi:hypothetical protein [Streptomyces filamentosus]|uniref:hypothetical protein n=1 Tax=Streptomyces filamentosus TaxID=67294 RepID=UPI001238536E|nr:hypothetical protein [Streptomyces filamentosus]